MIQLNGLKLTKKLKLKNLKLNKKKLKNIINQLSPEFTKKLEDKVECQVVCQEQVECQETLTPHNLPIWEEKEDPDKDQRSMMLIDEPN